MSELKYKTIEGNTISTSEPLLEGIDNYFKVNLPSSIEDFTTGNGEGVWCKSTRKYTDMANSKDFNNVTILVEILNDSLYYKGLMCGDIIPVELRGCNRPVAYINELEKHYGKADKVGAFKKLGWF